MMFREVATAVPPVPPGIQYQHRRRVNAKPRPLGSDPIEWSLEDFGPLVPAFDPLWIDHATHMVIRQRMASPTNDGHGFPSEPFPARWSWVPTSTHHRRTGAPHGRRGEDGCPRRLRTTATTLHCIGPP